VAKRGQLKPVDEAEESVRNNAVGYKVVLFVPRSSNRDSAIFANFDTALEYAKKSMEEFDHYRCAMIYAFDKIEKFMLHGTLKREQEYKKCVPASY